MKESKFAIHSCLLSAGLIAIFGILTVLAPLPSGAQQQSDSVRKVVEKTPAAYPPLARNMALQGIVKIDVLVSPDGTVKETQVRGGHPVLAQAAVNAVRRWRWETAMHESHETVEVKFSPE